MINKTKIQAKEDMKNYKNDQFQLYSVEAGWESWMEEYTEAEDGEEFIEEEGEKIQSIQREMWQEVHNVY